MLIFGEEGPHSVVYREFDTESIITDGNVI